VEDKLQELGQP